MAIFYTPLTDFLTKDTLPKEDPDKVILGADFTAEFNAISTAFAGAAPILDPNFNGTVTFVDATGGSLTVTGTLAGGSLAISGNGTIDGNLDVGGTITSDGSEIPTLEDVQDLIQDAELSPISILNDLADVNVTNVVDGETIVWDDANSVWVPGESGSSNVYALPVTLRTGTIELPLTDDGISLAVMTRAGEVELPLAIAA
mgnify:CR=1 FL=1